MKPVSLRLSIGLMLSIVLLISAANGALAQNYPNKPIRFIVPFAPGGSYDILARTFGQKLTDAWGQQVVVDNRGGGNTVIGTEAAAKAAPDGYTILMGGVMNLAIVPCLYGKLSYDTTKDFSPVTFVGYAPLVLVVNPNLPVKSVKELIALAKSKPGKLNYASSGSGGSSHLAMELFKTMAGVDIVHVPFKGGTTDLVGIMNGDVEMGFNSIVQTMAHVRSGKLRVLAVASEKRSEIAPDVPTVAESGLLGFKVDPWFGVVAPAGTPKEIVMKLNAEINKILKDGEVKDRLAKMGIETVGTTPEQFGQHIKAEIAKWAKVVKESGARVD